MKTVKGIIAILDRQAIPYNEMSNLDKILVWYYKRYRYYPLALVNVYMYGFIQGKKAERARRRLNNEH